MNHLRTSISKNLYRTLSLFILVYSRPIVMTKIIIHWSKGDFYYYRHNKTAEGKINIHKIMAKLENNGLQCALIFHITYLQNCT